MNRAAAADATWTNEDFAERRGVGFVAGWSAGPGSPNVGRAEAVRPVTSGPRRSPGILRRARLVTGLKPRGRCCALRRELDPFVGVVPDLRNFYAGLRLAVVPIRYGSGVKLKAIEALQSGVPAIATTVGAEGIPIDVPGLLPVADDPREFADLVALLLEEEEGLARNSWSCSLNSAGSGGSTADERLAGARCPPGRCV